MRHKSLVKYFLILDILLILSGCCRYVDCLTNEYSCRFVIKDKISGDDLVFGPNKFYNKSEMRCYSVISQDTVNFEITFLDYYSSISDSVISIIFYPKPTGQIYFSLNRNDIDTINLKFNSFNTTCCGNITEISNVNINMLDFQVERNPIQIFK